MINFIAVFIGGGIGASLRYFLSEISKKVFTLPLAGTLFANIIGCLFIGYFCGHIQKSIFCPQYLKSFVTIGLLGGLTTFSSFSNESICLFKQNRPILATTYILGTLSACLISTVLGYYLSSK